jgi:tetratricopeptide (TPR) repeat protein
MLRNGKSFSGNERNRCFLNVGTEKFADLSVVSGLDLIDDGRAIAPVDWDHDGDLDLWFGNRTGPRLRFMRNEAPSDHHYLAVALEGVDCNRDAIGARVELTISGANGSGRKRILKSLRAGEGYLSQSGKVLHFGLGTLDEIESLRIAWPDGSQDEYDQLDVDRRYKITQGESKAKPLTVRQQVDLALSAPHVPPRSEQAAILLSERVALPRLEYQTLSGEKRLLLNSGEPGPRLINLWATWCEPCLHELVDFAQHENALRDAQLDIIALATDGLQEEPSSNSIEETLDRLKFPFRGGVATTDLVAKLQIVLDNLFNDSRQIPLPSSFLIDSEHRLAAVYRGPVTSEQLLRDTKRLKLNGEALRIAAHGASGRWFLLPPPTELTPMVEDLRLASFVDEAIEYAVQHRELLSKERNVSILMNRLGSALGRKGQAEQAIEFFRIAVNQKPGFVLARYNLAAMLLSRGETAAAIEQLQQAVQLDPSDLDSHRLLQRTLRQAKQFEAAIAHLKNVVEKKIKLPGARFELAAHSVRLTLNRVISSKRFE